MGRGRAGEYFAQANFMADRHVAAVHGEMTAEYCENEEFNKKIIEPWVENAPKFVDFKEVYDPSEIKRDMRTVTRKRTGFLESGRAEGVVSKSEVATVAEPIILEGVYSYYWLGDNVNIAPTNVYDDFKRGVDCVASFETDNGTYVHLGIDTTTNTDPDGVRHKFSHTVRRLKEGNATQLKYFKNDDLHAGVSGYPNGKVLLPRVVVGIEPDRVTELQDAMVKRGIDLSNHEIKFELLHEIVEQLKFSLDLLLSESGVPEYASTDDVEEQLEFVSSHTQEIRQTKGHFGSSIKVHADTLAEVWKEYSAEKEKGRSESGLDDNTFTRELEFNQLHRMAA